MTSRLNHGGTSFKTINETGALSLDPLLGVRIDQYEFQVLNHFPMEQQNIETNIKFSKM